MQRAPYSSKGQGHDVTNFSVHDNARFRLGDETHSTKIDTQININSPGNSSGKYQSGAVRL